MKASIIFTLVLLFFSIFSFGQKKGSCFDTSKFYVQVKGGLITETYHVYVDGMPCVYSSPIFVSEFYWGLRCDSTLAVRTIITKTDGIQCISNFECRKGDSLIANLDTKTFVRINKRETKGDTTIPNIGNAYLVFHNSNQQKKK